MDSGLKSKSELHRARRLANIHILILISSERAGDLVKRLFMNLGFTSLYMAYDAAEAVQYLRDMQLHLIITDEDLKVSPSHRGDNQSSTTHETLGLSGIQFVHRLRSASSSPAPFIPVLMLMDHARDREVKLARDAGVNEIVLKPLEARNFCERIIEMIDHPHPYITADSYRGPCRRRKDGVPPDSEERRVREVRLVRCNEMKKGIRT